MLTVAEAAQGIGRSMSTIRRRIRSRLPPATMADGCWRVDPDALDALRGGIYPMLELPAEWRRLVDGTPVLNWVAGIELSRIGH